ncbi:MAG: hypothetical protein HYY97_11825 [Rhodocyclales bacterium]|nr:hypothetical protein [Rhodocyclales bacterium]
MPNAGFTPLEHWRRHANQLREGLLHRIDELSASDYPAETPELISFLQDFLGELAGVIEKASTEDRLRTIRLLIQQLIVFLDWLDNAHSGQTPRGLGHIVRDLIRRMEPGARVVTRPQNAYNYSILNVRHPLKQLVEEFIPHSKQGPFLEYLTSSVHLISFPRIERDNILAHAIFGHELGHTIADAYLIQEGSDPKYVASQTAVQKKIADIVDSSLADEKPDEAKKLEHRTRIFDQILQVRKRALEELISDSVGIFLFGPSAFFALFELLWGGGWDNPPVRDEWYPPSRFRLRNMLRQIDDFHLNENFDQLKESAETQKYIAAVLAYVDEGRRIAAETSDQNAIDANPLMKIAYDWMLESLDAAISFSKDKTSAVAFELTPAIQQLPELIQRLEFGIPPNEVGDPLQPTVVDYRSSLLAAWMYKLCGTRNSKGEILSSKDIAEMNTQTLRAVEYVILQIDYRNHIAANAAGVEK